MLELSYWWRGTWASRIQVLVLLSLGVVVASWFVLPWFAQRRQYRALGYTGDGGSFNERFLALRVSDGDSPSKAFDVLKHGSRVSYYRQTRADGEPYLVQRFDYSIVWGGPDIYVIYPASPPARKVIRTKYTDSFSTSRSERIADSTAYRILRWSPALGSQDSR
jgi:hypothetical protein